MGLDGCIRLFVLTVATNAKCLFNRLVVDLYTAANAFQSIDLHASNWRDKGVDSEVDADSKDLEKRTRQSAATVANSVKYHSNRLRENPSIVRNDGKNIGLPGGTSTK